MQELSQLHQDDDESEGEDCEGFDEAALAENCGSLDWDGVAHVSLDEVRYEELDEVA